MSHQTRPVPPPPPNPDRKQPFRAAERAEAASDLLFYVGAALSIAVLCVEQTCNPALYAGLLIAFAVVALLLFVIGLFSKLYLVPRADDRLREEFLSSAHKIDLTPLRSEGYFSNGFEQPDHRLAAQLLENCLYSKAIALRMAQRNRWKVGVYLFVWFGVLLNRGADLGIVVAVSQAVFSEQVISRSLRLEWLRTRFERVFDDVYRLFLAAPPLERFAPMAAQSMSMYESAKATAGITFSSSAFASVRPELDAEWAVVRRTIESFAPTLPATVARESGAAGLGTETTCQ